MFESDIQQLTDTFAADTIGEQSSITLPEVLASALPRGIAIYFRGEVEWWLFEEEQAHYASRRFNYRAPEAQALWLHFEAMLRRTATFRRDEFQATMNRAVKIRFNYLCRPQETLTTFLFRDAESASYDELLHRLAYFSDYDYYLTILPAWVRKRQLRGAPILRSEFEKVLGQIDDEILHRSTIDDLMSLMHPLFEFAGVRNGEVHRDALKLFFQDKGISRIVSRLSEETTETLSESKLRIIIEELLDVHPPAVETPEPEPEEIILSHDDLSTAPALVAERELEEAIDLGLTPDAPTLEEQTLEASAFIPSGSVLAHGNDSHHAFGSQERFALETSPLRDVRSIIDSSNREKFIKKIFSRNESDYEQAIDTLNAMHSWKEASTFIDSIFIRNDVDPYSKSAIRFTDSVYSRFVE